LCDTGNVFTRVKSPGGVRWLSCKWAKTRRRI